MPTQNQSLTVEWIDVKSTLSLVNGTQYVFQNTGAFPIRVIEAATEPSVDSYGRQLVHNSEMLITPNPDVNIYVRVIPKTSQKGNLTVTIEEAVKTSPSTEVSAFGELITANIKPLVQVKSVYGIHDNVNTTEIGSGTATVEDNLFTVKTGTTANSFGIITGSRPIVYLAGQGSLCRISARFDEGVTNFRSGAGFFSNSDVLTFGYEGADFGITYASGGVSAVYELDLTAAASGAETATVTIEGVAQNVAITAGTEAFNAFELVDALAPLYPLWRFDQIDGSVVMSRITNGAVSGVFSYSSTGTSEGTMTSSTTGVATTRVTIPQAEWNTNTMPLLDPSKLNVYQVRYQFLGSGDIKFYVEDPDTGDFILVHIIKYPNSAIIPSMANPSMFVGWQASSVGSTTDLGVQGASVMGAREGDESATARESSYTVTHTSVSTTEQTHLTVKGRRIFGGKTNRGVIEPFDISIANDGNKAVVIRGYKNCAVTGTTNFEYENEPNSIALIEGSQNSVGADCDPFLTLTIPKGGAVEKDLTAFDVEALSQDELVFTSQVVSGSPVEVTLSLIWKEVI